MKLSICIPSFNRGHRAFELVKRCLKMKYEKGEIEVICSNNGSDKNVEGYQELKQLNDARFVYHEFSENKGFAANLNQVIKMSKGDFCILLSDEDWIVEKNLDFYLQLIQVCKDFSVIVGRSGFSYKDLQDSYSMAGKDAIDAFYMRGIYISGLMFNRRVVTDEMLDIYEEYYRDNKAYQCYPHLFISTYALLHGNFCSSSVLLISEGATEEDLVVMDQKSEIPAYDAYEKVWEQMHGFVMQICDLDILPQMKFDMLIMVYQQHSYLIRHRKKGYIKGGYDYRKIMELTAQKMKEELKYVNIPLSDKEEERVYEFIESITINEENLI